MSEGDVARYHEARARIGALVAGADPSTPVPACPGWTVKDVVGHLAGATTDIADPNLEGAPGDSWTARQVEARRPRTLEECLEEWASNASGIAPVLESPMGRILVADGVRAAARTMLKGFERRLVEQGLPALRVVRDGAERVAGEGEPAGTLRVSSFDLLRSVAGRRTPDQVRALDWDGDADTWLPALFLFGPAEADVDE